MYGEINDFVKHKNIRLTAGMGVPIGHYSVRHGMKGVDAETGYM